MKRGRVCSFAIGVFTILVLGLTTDQILQDIHNPIKHSLNVSGNFATSTPTSTPTATASPTPSGGIAQYEAAVAADSPFTWWKLDEAAGTTATDSGSGGNNGTYTGSPALNQSLSGITGGKSIQLDGTTPQYVINTSDTGGCSAPWSLCSNATLTVEGWIYIHGANAGGLKGGMLLASIKGPSDWGWYIQAFNANAAKIGFVIAQAGGATYLACTSTTAPLLDTWYYVVGTWNSSGTTSKIYVNGVLENTCNVTSGTIGSGQTLNAGSQTVDPTNYSVNGNIQQVAVYHTVLSDARILAHYNAHAP